MKKHLISLYVGILLTATFLVVSTPVFAIPIVDGFLSLNEYSNSFEAGFYKVTNQSTANLKKPMTT